MTPASTCCSDTWLDLPSRSPAHTQPYTLKSDFPFFFLNPLLCMKSVTTISSEIGIMFY